MIYPSYVRKKKSNLISCLATISDEFEIVDADDYIYNFLNKLACVNILDYVHPDYKKEFRDFCYNLGTDKSGRLVVPICDGDGDYHMLDVSVSAYVTLDGNLLYRLAMYNISAIEEKFLNIHFDSNKYKTFLSMYTDMYFDYDVSKDVFTILKYTNVRATVFIKDTFENVYNKILSVYKDDETRQKFKDFMENVKNAPLHFQNSFMAPDPNDVTLLKMVKIDGMVVYRADKSKVVIGRIKFIESQGDVIIPYYKTAAGLDSATGLLNKKSCYEYTQDTLNNDDIHYMAIIDIDDFKNINDTYGHLFGDEVINSVAQIISSAVSGRGIVGRFGGDEFFILTSYITKEVQLRSILTSMRQKILTAFEDKVRDLRITLSIGISQYPKDGKDYYELFKLADKCLYRAKQKGKNRYIIYNPATHAYMNEDNSVIAMSHTKKIDMLSESLADVFRIAYKKEEGSLQKALDFIRERYEIDGIRIYDENINKPLLIIGSYPYSDKLDDNVYNKSGVNKLFENKKYILINNIEHYKNDKQGIYIPSKNIGVSSFMAVMITDSDNKDYYIFYDMFKDVMRWNETDKIFLLAISRMIVDILND